MLCEVIKYMKPAKGRDLDRIGEMCGVYRWRWWVFAWPLDYWFRKRVLAVHGGQR
jgi:hypothetical protein